MKQKDIKGLYLITPNINSTAYVPVVNYAVQKGVTFIQYRNKEKPVAEKRTDLEALMSLVPSETLIVNDDIDLAADFGLGVHLGKDDENVAQARHRLGKDVIIGASCYADMAMAQDAVMAGASYLAFGSVFASPTKKQATNAPLSIFSQAKKTFPDIPLVAIGGITPGNASMVFDAGADAIAVISAVFAAPDPYLAIDQFLEVIHAISF